MTLNIDNLSTLKPFLIPDCDFFYPLYIMTRNKDHGLSAPEKSQKNRIIKEYYIESIDYLERKYSEIQTLCKIFNARAYINLNRINKHDLGVNILEQLTHKMKHNDSNYLNILSKAIGNTKTDRRIWIVDIDNPKDIDVQQIINYIDSIKPLSSNTKFLAQVPTVSGLHLLTTPFDLQQFKQFYPQIDVQKCNPTLLYYHCPQAINKLSPSSTNGVCWSYVP